MSEYQLKKSESKIQQEIWSYFWNTFCLPKHEPREMIFHVPNENQHRLIRIGVYPGCSDLVISWRGSIYFVEVKTEKGRQSLNQEQFERHCNQSGFIYVLVRSLDEFKEFLLSLGDGVQ